ncbi:hypothetical protein EN871_17040 [bacterium M00.F.Ca.ET.228.01.1.1]|uniref:hypothetical protein n=1 Tax=Paraburkholderia phenoliruptrix TaxID=252970 RepID=UPI0010925A33|nr:hypothetical protein [Paraburkholderia phenoliruptrix]TGP42649.1 hypothetical protein EN871_17040 [bacterium M00.F.Ca.ET.228.01.1.1]TGR95374.1 hypothetical protein EN834_31685 [bacterium M00.F.Ca.ET.191.01.1.1]TGT96263.1 hypothetical protein EN798_31695 [bacterium M00.F.Ca.ET.155.01.1.1]MBW0447442.1 hypothetical protein [Paraburkholderia phenoliruptrix]MBW9098878.1 hypothetical protein [Paraburkholderia phenoliruptrix]
MVTNRHAERELVHIVSMIGQLERLLEQEARLPPLAVFELAYWRARIQCVTGSTGSTGSTDATDGTARVTARASALLARLDALGDAAASGALNSPRNSG